VDVYFQKRKDILDNKTFSGSKLFFLFFLLISVLCFAQGPELKIGLATSQRVATFKAEKGFNVFDGRNRTYIADKTLNVRKTGRTYQINSRSFGGNDGIIIEPAGDEFLIEFKDFRYRGKFLLSNTSNVFHVINLVSTEHYLYGVIANEMLRTAPLEALKTLSIVARTYALKNIGRHSADGFDLCNTTHCQVYRGYNTECDEIRNAVDLTRGIAIYYEEQLISAYHHSACGGGTANNENVWSGSPIPYLRGRWCNFCEESPRASWELDLKMNELTQKLKGLDVGKIKRISTHKQDEFGRVSEVRVTGEKTEKIMGANQFRLLIGAMKMWNTMFELRGYGGNSSKINDKVETIGGLLKTDRKDFIKNIILETEEKRNEIFYEGYKIQGSGSGHGVGLCQWGSIGLARKGLTFREIIPFYYAGVELKKKY